MELAVVNNITVSFQTAAAQGTLLYVDQSPANPHFFMKLFVLDGLLQVETSTFLTTSTSSQFKSCSEILDSHALQYAFCCNEEEGVTQIGTSVPVDDDRVNVVNIRYYFLHSLASSLGFNV